MKAHRLSDLITGISVIERNGISDPLITSVVYDSRAVEPGSLFIALEGIHTDGHRYIDAAIDSGAAAVVHSRSPDHYRDGIDYIRVADSRIAMSPVAASFWDHPSREMKLIGVTGTDGKSTTVSLIRQLLGFTGASAGSLSTVEFNIGGKAGSNYLRQSTPEAPDIHQLLRSMRDAGHSHAVVEATSHGLSPRTGRLADVDFDAAVFTNVTSEHLEFHGSLEQYRADKARLFGMISESRNRDAFGVVNGDDPHSTLFINAAGEKPVFIYSLKNPEADLYADDLRTGPAGTRFRLHTPEGEIETGIGLPCLYNVENALAALATAAELQDEDALELARFLPELKGIKGRMEPITGDMSFHVMVDYAHSPGSFLKVLPFLREMAEGRLIVVFGSGGERDLDKRPRQGELAQRFADIVILADEDPRGEVPMKLLEDIASGIHGMRRGENLFLIPDRREALKKAFMTARAGDLVAALGKGHERTIIYKDRSIPWDEAEMCRSVLRELGYEVV